MIKKNIIDRCTVCRNVLKQFVPYRIIYLYLAPLSFKAAMFFFGAFSGNMIYLILAISYLAGCSSLVFRDSGDQTNTSETPDITSSHILYDNLLPEHSFNNFTVGIDHVVQALSQEDAVRVPIIPFTKALFIPPLLTDKSHFSGSAQFSRPPPFSLV